jgi:hypothetical protein
MTTAAQVRVLDTIEVFTPLGLRFWDAALDRAILDGLRVVARPLYTKQQIEAVRTRSGIYTFRWLPGMRAVEHRYPDPGFFDASTPQRRPFVIAVEDTLERFLPAAFRVDLPLPYSGVFLSESEASVPDGTSRGVLLFSASTRRTDERLTAVRGTLIDDQSKKPVAWAHVIVTAPHSQTFHGLADDQGRFAVFFPYPSLAEGFAGSPGSFGQGTPIGARGWDITLAVRAQPSALQPLPGTALFEYSSLFTQLGAGLWSSIPDPSTAAAAQLDLHLQFGQQLIVRTNSLSEQLVRPAAASP